jgi:hypothetical protein
MIINGNIAVNDLTGHRAADAAPPRRGIERSSATST